MNSRTLIWDKRDEFKLQQDHHLVSCPLAIKVISFHKKVILLMSISLIKIFTAQTVQHRNNSKGKVKYKSLENLPFDNYSA